MVFEPAEGHPLPDMQPLQVAHHQDHLGSAAADHGGPVSLQHARLSGQEAAWGLKRGQKGCTLSITYQKSFFGINLHVLPGKDQLSYLSFYLYISRIISHMERKQHCLFLVRN